MAQGIPQPLASPGQVVAHQRAAVVAAAGQDGDDVYVRADGDAAGGAAQAHGLVKAGEAQPQLAAVAAHAHHPPGQIGGEQHRELQVLQQGGQALGVLVAHVDRLELRGW